MRGLLLRQLPVRLLNVSMSGFFLESDDDIPTGTTGNLQLDLRGATRRDHIHVVRSVHRPGSAHRFLVGGQFFWSQRPAPDSVREAVRDIQDHA